MFKGQWVYMKGIHHRGYYEQNRRTFKKWTLEEIRNLKRDCRKLEYEIKKGKLKDKYLEQLPDNIMIARKALGEHELSLWLFNKNYDEYEEYNPKWRDR